MALRAEPVSLTLTVEDSDNAPIAAASVQRVGDGLAGRTNAEGRLTFRCALPCRVRVEAEGFAGANFVLTVSATIHLERAGANEQVTVTAYRAPMGELASPVTTRELTQQTLSSTAAITLDGTVRQLPGVELFRRSSSLVANPTSQGISVRGLGSTAASRTLVIQDGVPLNDALGGWIHWEETPELALDGAELVRGGASDLYGSSAIGGVLNLHTVQPSRDAAELRSSYGSEGTYDETALAQAVHGGWGLLVAGGALGTDGYIQQAPWQRGPVDVASNVHSQNGLVLSDRKAGVLRVFARVSAMNEARGNGTSLQTNGTRLWRYAGGGDWSDARGDSAALRAYGATEHYRQAFTSVLNTPPASDPTCTYRCGETLTRRTLAPLNEWGAAAHAMWPHTVGIVLLVGADVHDTRVWDGEQTHGSAAQLTQLNDHQRDAGAYAQALWIRGGWTMTAAARLDWYENYDGSLRVWNGTDWVTAATQPVQSDERLFDPRIGVARKVSSHWAVSSSAFRAFRAPTPSELYRSTQVGNKLTLPNSALASERATGWEAGVAYQSHWATLRASTFLTQVNRPIVAVTTNANSSPILLKRENLGQIESRGFALDFESVPRSWLRVDGGYQYAHATVTRGPVDVGNWIPAVARNMATLNLRAERSAWGELSVQTRMSGRQYDDDANAYLLHGYFRADAYAARAISARIELFAASENLFDRSIEVAKTPSTTLGMPRAVRCGVWLRIGRSQ